MLYIHRVTGTFTNHNYPPFIKHIICFLTMQHHKLNLPDTRRSLKMEIAQVHVGKSGFEGLADDELFNKILQIKNDKFVLHSGVRFPPYDRHCPLIMELIHLMSTRGIPFNTSPIIENCERKHQEDRSFNFSSVDLPDGVAVTSIHPHEEGGGRRKRSNRKHKRKSLNRRKRTKRIKKW